ncbi:Glyoxylate reductase [Sulfobacillus acidophilus TPY]|nr:Glyoxylate reductase [Sulfobacillus acidophilus TPY]
MAGIGLTDPNASDYNGPQFIPIKGRARMADIVVTRKIAPVALKELESVGTVKLWEEDRSISPAVLREWVRTADALLSMLTDPIDDTLLASAPRLRIVANMAVGYDNIDVKAATRRKIAVTNTPDVLTEATADLTWALLLALLRGVLSSHQALRQGAWDGWRPDGFLGTEVHGKVLGIVGLGRIGRAVAERARGFHMPVIALASDRARPDDGIGIKRMARDEFLARADIVSLHAPLTPDTRHMVNRQWLFDMKPGAFLINTARGALIDEAALLEALNRGRVAGAALDVFEHEPVSPDHPLVVHPRVLATPHIGSATRETREQMAVMAARNIVWAIQGLKPPQCLNPEVWSD